MRQQHPGIRVIVHPECPREVVAAADQSGSTEQIIRAVTASPEGTAWAIGTESNLVQPSPRAPQSFHPHPERQGRPLRPDGPSDPVHLLWVLDNLAQGKVVNQVKVPDAIAADARVALERMLAIRPPKDK